MNNPRLFSKIDADRILKRASEIEGSEDVGPLTAEEIRSIAGEAGFGHQAVELALAEAQQAAYRDAHRPPVQRSGAVITTSPPAGRFLSRSAPRNSRRRFGCFSRIVRAQPK